MIKRYKAIDTNSNDIKYNFFDSGFVNKTRTYIRFKAIQSLLKKKNRHIRRSLGPTLTNPLKGSPHLFCLPFLFNRLTDGELRTATRLGRPFCTLRRSRTYSSPA